MLLAKLCGHDTPEAMADWAKVRAEGLAKMLNLSRRSMPHSTTLLRVLRNAISPEELEEAIRVFMTRQIRKLNSDQICIDGKQIRGTQDKEGEGNVYLLGAYAPGVGVMLMQMELGVGEGELSVAPRLLKSLELRGKVVTGDAGFAQRNLSVQIVEAGGEYVWKVKANQPRLLEDIELLFGPPLPTLPGSSTPKTDFQTAKDQSCANGRVDSRTLTTSSQLQVSSDWPNLKQVFRIETDSLNKKTGKRTPSISYGVTSLCAAEADPRRLLKIARGHWGIEGGSHQRRDTTFNEDGCDLQRGHAAHIMAILNNIAISLLVLAGFRNVAHGRRTISADPEKAFSLLVFAK
jgi:predicted transposase YbfD/YdcC